jgi:hypothetical protein
MHKFSHNLRSPVLVWLAANSEEERSTAMKFAIVICGAMLAATLGPRDAAALDNCYVDQIGTVHCLNGNIISPQGNTGLYQDLHGNRYQALTPPPQQPSMQPSTNPGYNDWCRKNPMLCH